MDVWYTAGCRGDDTGDVDTTRDKEVGMAGMDYCNAVDTACDRSAAGSGLCTGRTSHRKSPAQKSSTFSDHQLSQEKAYSL